MRNGLWDLSARRLTEALPLERSGMGEIIATIAIIFPLLRDLGVRLHDYDIDDEKGLLIAWQDREGAVTLQLRPDGLIDGCTMDAIGPARVAPLMAAPGSMEMLFFARQLAQTQPSRPQVSEPDDRFLPRRYEVADLPEGALPFLDLIGLDEVTSGVPLMHAIERLSVDQEEGRALAWLRQASRDTVAFVVATASIPHHPYYVPPSLLQHNADDLHPWLLAAAPILHTAQRAGRDVVGEMDRHASTITDEGERREWIGKAAKAFFDNPALGVDEITLLVH